MTKKRSQNMRILDYMSNVGPLTGLEALKLFGCFRLASRIYDIKQLGVTIIAKRKELPNGKSVAEYHLIKLKGAK